MAKKRRPVKLQSESDDEGNNDQTTALQKNSVESQQTKLTPPPHSSSEEEDTGSESESEPEKSHSKSEHGGKKSRSKPEKRSVEETVSKEAKKMKTAAAETSEKKPNPFQRLWSEEDEIVLLQEILDYSKKNKSDPTADLDAFHACIRKKLHIDFSRAQLLDKMRKLKKKFEINNGKKRSFSKAHEQAVYDLSKEIWGNALMEKTVVPDSSESLQIEGETDLQKLKMVEHELYIKELQLRLAQAYLVLAALKNEGMAK